MSLYSIFMIYPVVAPFLEDGGSHEAIFVIYKSV